MTKGKTGFAENIGTDVMVSGDFGELLLAYYFVKKKLHVIIAQSVGFDLLVKDKKGVILPKNKLIGISVKTRQQKSYSIDLRSDRIKLKKASKIWKFIPYFCFISPLEAVIFPLNAAFIKYAKTDTGWISLPRLKKIKSDKKIHFKWRIEEL